MIIETPRLLLRPLELSDLEGMWELDSNPKVHRYLGNNPVTEKSFLEKVILGVQKQVQENGFGRFAVEWKETGAFVGWAGLKLVKEPLNGKMEYVDVGYRIIERFWGKGIGYEGAWYALKYGFSILNLNEIYASAQVENRASNRILTKCGMTLIQEYEEDQSLVNEYRITLEEWFINSSHTEFHKD